MPSCPTVHHAAIPTYWPQAEVPPPATQPDVFLQESSRYSGTAFYPARRRKSTHQILQPETVSPEQYRKNADHLFSLIYPRISPEPDVFD